MHRRGFCPFRFFYCTVYFNGGVRLVSQRMVLEMMASLMLASIDGNQKTALFGTNARVEIFKKEMLEKPTDSTRT